jgi:hypothetical protein
MDFSFDKKSTQNSSEDISSSRSFNSNTSGHFFHDKPEFKYKNFVYKEEDLFPNQELFSFLLDDNKQKIENNKEDQKEIPINFKSEESNLKLEENVGLSVLANKQPSLPSKQTLSQNALTIAKKLKKIILKNIKSNKTIPEPEDQEYYELVKSKKAFIETVWTDHIFFEWKYKSELKNSTNIVKFV